MASSSKQFIPRVFEVLKVSDPQRHYQMSCLLAGEQVFVSLDQAFFVVESVNGVLAIRVVDLDCFERTGDTLTVALRSSALLSLVNGSRLMLELIERDQIVVTGAIDKLDLLYQLLEVLVSAVVRNSQLSQLWRNFDAEEY